MGHEVIVACERTSDAKERKTYKGARLEFFPFMPPEKYSLRKIYEGLNDIYFYLKLSRKCDVMYILAGLGTQILPFLRLLNPKIRIVTNNDGLEWKRAKYNFVERTLWKSFIRSSMRFSNLVIHDNPKLIDFFPRINRKNTISIPYGVEEQSKKSWSFDKLPEKLRNSSDMKSLSPGDYFIIIARLQEDNNSHIAIEGFINSNSSKKLLVVGDPQDPRYLDKLKSIDPRPGDGRIIFSGSIYDSEALGMHRQHSFAYIHGHSAGGTNPSLLEAMSDKLAIIAHDNPFNRNVLDDTGLFFSSSYQISRSIERIEGDKDFRQKIRSSNFQRSRMKFTWKKCMETHEKAFEALVMQ